LEDSTSTLEVFPASDIFGAAMDEKGKINSKIKIEQLKHLFIRK